MDSRTVLQKLKTAHLLIACRSLLGVFNIPKSIALIGSWCFLECSSITSVTFDPTAHVELRPGAFCYCKSIVRVELPQQLTSIPQNCFSRCSSLSNINIPVSTVRIHEWAFEHCSSLQSADLPESIGWVGSAAFAYCTSLQGLTIRSSSHNVIIGTNIVNGWSALSKIKILPSGWPKLFPSMNDDPSFLHKFVREYQYQIKRLIE